MTAVIIYDFNLIKAIKFKFVDQVADNVLFVNILIQVDPANSVSYFDPASWIIIKSFLSGQPVWKSRPGRLVRIVVSVFLNSMGGRAQGSFPDCPF